MSKNEKLQEVVQALPTDTQQQSPIQKPLTASFLKRKEIQPIQKVETLPRTDRRSFHLTELGNAERLVHYFGEDLRYCPQTGQWLIWNGNRWEYDDCGQIVQFTKRTVRDIYNEAAHEPDEERRGCIARWAKNSESERRISAAIKLARTEQGITIHVNDLDRDPFLFGVANGTVDLRTGKLRESERHDYITKQAQVAFDPSAECPQWLAFLERITGGDPELIAYLQRLIGYSLTGSTKEQCLIILHGTGANGKTVFTVTLNNLLGDYALQIQAETLTGKPRDGGATPEIACLMGPRMVVAAEAEQGQPLREARVKELTGGDPIVARPLYANPFQFFPQFTLLLVTNHIPRIRGTDDGIWRRIHLVPFKVSIPKKEQDRELTTKLQGEFPGILNWAIQGCLAWQSEGLNPPPTILKATSSYRAEMDTLGEWLEASTVKNPTAKTSLAELHHSYVKWCNGSGDYPVSNRELGGKLRERGYKDRHIRSGKVFLGIGLKT